MKQTAFVKDECKQKKQTKYWWMKRAQWYNSEKRSIEQNVPATHMLAEEKHHEKGGGKKKQICVTNYSDTLTPWSKAKVTSKQ